MHVMHDSEDIIEYDMIIKFLHPQERCSFRHKFITLDWVGALPKIYLFTGIDKRARDMKTIKSPSYSQKKMIII